jgi:type VI protein secretion system component VasK
MKLMKRSVLLKITIVLAALLLIYTFLRTFTPIKLDETGERIAMNGVMLLAIGIFIMNRRVVAEEKKEAEAKEAAEKAKLAGIDE